MRGETKGYIPRECIIFGLPSLEFRVQIYTALRGLIPTSPRRESNQKWSQPGKIPGKPTRGKQKYSGERDSLPRSHKSPIDKSPVEPEFTILNYKTQKDQSFTMTEQQAFTPVRTKVSKTH